MVTWKIGYTMKMWFEGQNLVLIFLQVPLVTFLLLQGYVIGTGGEEAGIVDADSFIIGGQDVKPPGKWPWQGSLTYLGRHRCGAVLIAPYWVVTAAHCIGNASTNLLWVTFGLHDKDTQYEGDPQSYKLARIYIHPHFSESDPGLKNDIALLQLTADRPADVNNEYIKAVSMASDDASFNSQRCMITGWGRTKGPKYPGKAVPNILQEAPAEVIGLKTCDDIWGSRIFPGHICLSYNSTSSSCQGDSGGPLVCQSASTDLKTLQYEGEDEEEGWTMDIDIQPRKDLPWILAGIASWSDINCHPSKPSVYVRISHYRAWIHKVSGL